MGAGIGSVAGRVVDVVSNDVVRSVAMLARLGSRSGRIGDWQGLVRRVDALREQTAPDFIEQLYEAEYIGIVRLVRDLMLPTTTHYFLELVEARVAKEVLTGAWMTTQVERMFADVGEPWTTEWGSNDVSRSRGSGRAFEVALVRYMRSRGASDLARAISILEKMTQRARRGPAAPTRYSVQSLFQIVVAEPLLRAVPPTHWRFVMSYLANETAWNFDRYSDGQEAKSPPWDDARNGIPYSTRYNAITLSYEPLAFQLMRQFAWSGYPSIETYSSGRCLVDQAEDLARRDVREGRSDIWLALTGAFGESRRPKVDPV